MILLDKVGRVDRLVHLVYTQETEWGLGGYLSTLSSPRKTCVVNFKSRNLFEPTPSFPMELINFLPELNKSSDYIATNKTSVSRTSVFVTSFFPRLMKTEWFSDGGLSSGR